VNWATKELQGKVDSAVGYIIRDAKKSVEECIDEHQMLLRTSKEQLYFTTGRPESLKDEDTTMSSEPAMSSERLALLISLEAHAWGGLVTLVW
jgi:hypothetical protein